ncbi:MAG: hypothetical protein U0R76_10345 [Candidatus Nanopelagicales bacterium]
MSRERRIVVAALVALAVVAVVVALVVRRTPDPQAGVLPLRVTAYAQLSETRLLVEYTQVAGRGPAQVTVDESGDPVVLRAGLPVAEAGATQRNWLALGPLSSAVAVVDLAAPLGDRPVVDGSGAPLPQQSEQELRP